MDELPPLPAILEVIQQVSEIPLAYQNKKLALHRIAELTRAALQSRLCTIVQINLEHRRLVQVASAGDDPLCARRGQAWEWSFPRDANSPFFADDLRADGGMIVLANLDADGQGIVNPASVQKCGLRSALCFPLYFEDRSIGFLNHFVTHSGPFTAQDQRCMKLLANQAAVVMALVERMQKAAGYDRLQMLNQTMQEITCERTVENLMELMLQRAMELVDAERGWVSRFDMQTGELRIVAQWGQPPDYAPLSIGEGITGKALAEGLPQRADDVREPPWRSVYVAYWPDTISELAIPLLIPNAEVRVGTEISRGLKRIGVLNMESPRPAAFTSADENLLVSLAGHAAVLIDRLDQDHKWGQLTKVQKQIVGRRDWNLIIEDMLHAITATLGYDYVNVSLVDEHRERIRTEYVTGIPEDQVAKFKQMANHRLDDKDIQADIVRTRRIEVPPADDSRFDQDIYRAFGHKDMLRVFVPLVEPSTNRVIGTVEAGHLHSKRTHLYEHDVQILTGFVDYVARVLEQRQRGQMERITHELRSPVVGIRSNSSYLQRRMTTLPPDFVQLKMGDILADCEILLYQIAHLEHALGLPEREARVERTLVFRDIVIKTVAQLRSLAIQQGSDTDGITYDPADMRRIKPLYIRRGHLNQVVFNLLHNAIKYAEDDPSQFAIQIKVEDRPKDYVLVFKDWGIGIQEQYRSRVFEEGFRTPEALQKLVTGYGLGLSISKRLMNQMGGDLMLGSSRKPTEFRVILPKTLAEAPHDYDG